MSVIRIHVLAAVAASGVLVVAACGGEDPVAGPADGSAGTGGDASVPDGAAEDASVAPDGSREAFCMGEGPPIRLPDPSGTGELCTGGIAEDLFRYSLCTCEDVDLTTSRFATRSFDSTAGDEPTDSGAAVGVNGELNSIGDLDVGGSLTTAAAADLSLTGSGARVGGNLRSGGGLGFTGTASIARDAWVTGDVSGVGALDIARDLHLPSGASVAAGVSVGGDTVEGPVDVRPPCPCGADDILDVAAIVAAARTDNHNADVDLAPDAYTSLIGDNRLELPCGRFFLDGIAGTGNLTLAVDGRTALFIDGDLDTTGDIQVELGPEGELDVFVAGNLSGIGSVGFGSPDRPARTRVYVGGSDGIDLTTSSGVFVGNVYAPRAPATTTGTVDIYGALFARSLGATGELEIHYDRAILEAGDDCDTPPPEDCVGCGDCAGGLRCSGAGICLPECADDGDCCEPFACHADGSCGPILI